MRGRQHRWSRGIAADTDHDVGPKFADQLGRGHEGARQIEHSLSRVARSTRFSAPTWMRCSSKPAAGTSRVSMPRWRADEQNFRVVARAQLLRDGQRRDDMAAGAASCHDHAHG